MIQKCVTIYLLLIVNVYCVIGDCGQNASHNLFLGKREPFDEMLFMDIVERSGIWFWGRSTTLVYPLPGSSTEGYITYIEALDGYTNGNGGCAYLRSGGVGQNSATLELQSKWFHGLDFTLKIFGHKRIIPTEVWPPS